MIVGWWAELSAINQIFYCAATFFGVFFIWQMVMAFIGLGGDHDTDVDHDVGHDIDHDVGHAADADLGHDATYDHFEHGADADAVDSTAAFRVLSLRSVITFFTLFTLGGALYMDTDVSVPLSMTYSAIWGAVGMFLVALVFHWMRNLGETGTIRVRTAVGTEGQVYADIPAGGVGQVRATVSGVVTYLKARTDSGQALTSGTPVRILKAVSPSTVVVEPVGTPEANAPKEDQSQAGSDTQ